MKIDELNAWRDANPLRRWRSERKLSIRTMAGLIGTNMNSVQDWEQGQYRPRSESMTKIYITTEGAVGHEQWDAWMLDRPSIQA